MTEVSWRWFGLAEHGWKHLLLTDIICQEEIVKKKTSTAEGRRTAAVCRCYRCRVKRAPCQTSFVSTRPTRSTRPSRSMSFVSTRPTRFIRPSRSIRSTCTTHLLVLLVLLVLVYSSYSLISYLNQRGGSSCQPAQRGGFLGFRFGHSIILIHLKISSRKVGLLKVTFII